MTEKAKTKVKNKRSWLSYFKKTGNFDLTFFFLVAGLTVVGLIMLFSASAPYAASHRGSSYYFILRQLGFAVFGFVLMMLASRADYHIWQRLVGLVFILTMVMLIGVLFTTAQKGQFHRWLDIGLIRFQPSEIGKFSLILLLSYLIAKNQKRMTDFKYQMFLLMVIGLFCGLVLAENHLSATVLIFLIGLVLMFVGGMSLKLLGGMGILGISGFLMAVFTGLISYASDRIKYWQNPWLDTKDKGFQTIQSLLAIGSGGLMGRGIGQSNQKYLWLPEPQNDFIFSVVCEELGFIGAALIIVGFGLLVWRGFVIALKAPDKFGMLMAIGLVFQVGLQAVLNVLVVTNTIPNTGISLPFFSYGGTSLVMLLVQMGIVLNISRSSKVEKV